jgi:hypothetical protein
VAYIKGVSRGGGRRKKGGEDRRSVAKGRKELKPGWAWVLGARERGKISRVVNVLELPTAATSCFPTCGPSQDIFGCARFLWLPETVAPPAGLWAAWF